MNKHILLVMKWLNDKDSVSQEELVANRKAAYAAYAADAAYAAYDAAAYAAYDAAAYAAYAASHVNLYFELTSEDKQIYLNNL